MFINGRSNTSKLHPFIKYFIKYLKKFIYDQLKLRNKRMPKLAHNIFIYACLLRIFPYINIKCDRLWALHIVYWTVKSEFF